MKETRAARTKKKDEREMRKDREGSGDKEEGGIKQNRENSRQL
jgi:hypothetical protein